MVDFHVHSLLEQVINSRLKLSILVMFYEDQRMETTPTRLAERCCHDIWSMRQALYEMAQDGILSMAQSMGGEPNYRFAPLPQYQEQVAELVRSYDDPLKRETLFQSLREISLYGNTGSMWNMSFQYVDL